MAVEMTKIGVAENGAPLYHYSAPSGHIVITGPVKGFVTTQDGTQYNVSDDAIEVNSAEHAAEVAHLIGERHANDGHPTDPGFQYDDSGYKAALKAAKKG